VSADMVAGATPSVGAGLGAGGTPSVGAGYRCAVVCRVLLSCVGFWPCSVVLPGVLGIPGLCWYGLMQFLGSFLQMVRCKEGRFVSALFLACCSGRLYLAECLCYHPHLVLLGGMFLTFRLVPLMWLSQCECASVSTLRELCAWPLLWA
jgi:uncharacterized membrane protein (Fun14 family)